MSSEKKVCVSLKTGVHFTNKPSTGRRGYNWHKDKDFQHFYLILSNLNNLSSLKKKPFFQSQEKQLQLLNKTTVTGSVTQPSLRFCPLFSAGPLEKLPQLLCFIQAHICFFINSNVSYSLSYYRFSCHKKTKTKPIKQGQKYF